MPHLDPPDPLDLIPEPSEIHRRIATTVRAQRLLRRLLRLSLAARREREAGPLPSADAPPEKGADRG